jgi:hypothetical protein
MISVKAKVKWKITVKLKKKIIFILTIIHDTKELETHVIRNGKGIGLYIRINCLLLEMSILKGRTGKFSLTADTDTKLNYIYYSLLTPQLQASITLGEKS